MIFFLRQTSIHTFTVDVCPFHIVCLFVPCLSSVDWPLSSGKCPARLSLLPDLCSQRLPHRQIPGPAVCKSFLELVMAFLFNMWWWIQFKLQQNKNMLCFNYGIIDIKVPIIPSGFKKNSDPGKLRKTPREILLNNGVLCRAIMDTAAWQKKDHLKLEWKNWPELSVEVTPKSDHCLNPSLWWFLTWNILSSKYFLYSFLPFLIGHYFHMLSGLFFLCLPQRLHPSYPHGAGEQVFLPRVSYLLSQVRTLFCSYLLRSAGNICLCLVYSVRKETIC